MSDDRACKRGTVTFFYKIEHGSITITGASGVGSVLEIPAQLEEKTVTAIGKKAFLGQHALTEIIFPASVKYIESWALAQCRVLKVVVIQGRDVRLGNGVFEDCEKLACICMGSDAQDDLSVLLGTLPMRLQAEYLLLSGDIGTEQWYRKWDQKLVSFINEADDEGYTTLVLCGEEDILQSVPAYITNRRIAKAALCFIRLRYHRYLAAEYEMLFQDYILTHSKGASTDEAWQALIQEFGDDIAYYQLYAQLGGITAAGINEMLDDLGENHAEAKAYLMKYQAEHLGTTDIFESFSL